MIGAAAAAAWAAAQPAVATAVSPRKPTFTADIAPIVYARCTPCHRPGGPAPFPLLSYDEVREKGAEIAASTAARRMPPWHATQGPGFPALLNDARLSDQQIAAFATWVSRGMPVGNARELAPPPSFPSPPWPLGQPDVALTLARPVTIEAGSGDAYRNVVVPLDFPADVAINAIDYVPEERSLLRHARFFAAPASLTIRDEDALPGVGGLLGSGSLENYADQVLAAASSLIDLGGWTPGFARARWPEGYGMRIPAKSVLVIQMHFGPGDVDAVENGRVGLYFAKTGATRMAVPLGVPPAFGIASRLSVPPGDSSYLLADTFTLPVDVEALGARGYAHLLGRELTLTSLSSTDGPRGLLRITNWDPAWPETYLFAAPIHLTKGTTLRAEIRYDNSDANPRNLFSPPKRIGWGRLPSGEMGTLTLLITAPTPATAAVLDETLRQHVREQLLRKRP